MDGMVFGWDVGHGNVDVVAPAPRAAPDLDVKQLAERGKHFLQLLRRQAVLVAPEDRIQIEPDPLRAAPCPIPARHAEVGGVPLRRPRQPVVFPVRLGGGILWDTDVPPGTHAIRIHAAAVSHRLATLHQELALHRSAVAGHQIGVIDRLVAVQEGTEDFGNRLEHGVSRGCGALGSGIGMPAGGRALLDHLRAASLPGNGRRHSGCDNKRFVVTLLSLT